MYDASSVTALRVGCVSVDRIKTYEHERRWDKALSSYDMLLALDPLSVSTQTGQGNRQKTFHASTKHPLHLKACPIQ